MLREFKIRNLDRRNYAVKAFRAVTNLGFHGLKC